MPIALACLNNEFVTMVVLLPTALVARYRAVDREIIGSALVDTPAHLAAEPRPAYARTMEPDDLVVIERAIASAAMSD